nr:hypothetical protein [Tanacetum cinerariifolium]
MFDRSILDDEEVVAEEVNDEEVVAEKEVSTADPVTTAGEVVTTTGEVVTTAGVEVSTAAITSQISIDEITLAKALIDIKISKPKAKGIMIQEPRNTSRKSLTTTISSRFLLLALALIKSLAFSSGLSSNTLSNLPSSSGILTTFS